MADDEAAPTVPVAVPAPVVGYPLHWEADVVLRDGGTAHVRPIRPEDADALQEFHVGQSQRSTYFRFFAPLERLPDAELERFTHVDHQDRVALVAVSAEDGTERIIAVARFDRTGPTTAEVAFNVSDRHHGRGLGSVLLEHLAAAAQERGVHRFTAEVLPQNGRMLAVFREAGYEVRQRLDDGIVWVSFDVDPTERSLAVMADREHRAEARSVLGLLTPASVLVVTDEGAPDHAAACAVVRHLLQEPPGAPGPVAVAPAPGDGARAVPVVHVVGWSDAPAPARAWPSAAQVPPVDLLVLGVPAERCADVVRRCAHLRPHAVLVLSSGFAETGPDGVAYQRDLVRAAHAIGARVLGPGSYGFVRHDERPVNASLAARAPEPGRLGLLCQSAPMAVGLLTSARRRGLGLSTFVSSGHRADVSGNDLMQFWTEDPRTDVVAAYLESIGNPRKFARVARRLAAVKPVVVLTAGSSGHVAPAGHVLRDTRVPRRVLDELLRQSGVIRATSQHHLLDVAQLLVHQPLPAGRRVTVLAGSEPMAALVAEAATSAGLTVTSRRAILSGPAAEDVERLEADLADAYADPAGDVVVVAYVPTLGPPHPRVARSLARAAAASGKTTVACIRGLSGVTEELTAPDGEGRARTVPAYAAPEDGVAALAAAVRHARWRAADHGRPLAPSGIDRATARRIVQEALAAAAGAPGLVVGLDDARTAELLGAYGIEVWPVRTVQTPEEARAAADELGWPVALKSAAGTLRHRMDLGAVRLDLSGPAALDEAVAQIRRVVDAHGESERRFEVQRMAPPGAACVVRSSEDPRFGPVVSFGLAGDAVDLLDDVSHGVAPLTDVDVAEMVRGVRTAPRLFGYGGLPALDVAALEDVLARVASLAEDVPELHALELHPVVVGEHGAAVLSARVELSEAERVDGRRRALPE